ncbi:family 78 glycoside hydrolase catalytic domain [Arthrobacter sp. NPDC058097]|uniref:family 78 glycoside hydrolase catalytic domain n=1 Tax=Arthrobacter sp. NPDC058097 TaxID=3346340 RepID=UPI0036D77A25
MLRQVQAARPRFENLTDDTFVAVDRPRLSWKIRTELPGWIQESAEIEVTRATGIQTSVLGGRESVLVDWPFAPLSPRESVALRVRVHGTDGSASDWSPTSTITAGFLAEGEWRADFVGSGAEAPSMIRTSFHVDGDVTRATLYTSALGVFDAELNGADVDDHVLKPGWTSYQWRLPLEATDVTGHIRAGRNTLGILVAGGWYTERFGFRDAAKRFYEGSPAAAGQLVIDYADGRSQTILTGTSSLWAPAPITASSLYQGETYDARLEVPGWSTPELDDSEWQHVHVRKDVDVTPTARRTPPVRRIEELPVHDVLTTPSGATVLDFGQNLVGWLRINVRGEEGRVITLRHAEVLEHGELGVRPLRNAAATDRYVLKGTGTETWEPRFTFHGFRYAQIDGWPGALDPADVTAVVVHTDMPRTGGFESSHELLNKFHGNVVWGMRGNFLSVPTDCPQRDERLGWTGDIQVFTPTAAFLYDCNAFLGSWLQDLALEQTANEGIVPMVVPAVIPQVPGLSDPVAAWGDAATVVPTVLHQHFGDLDILRQQYDSMRSWVDVLCQQSGEDLLWQDGLQFGDWLDPDAHPDRPGDAKVNADIVATAYFYRSAELTAHTAAQLGDSDGHRKYSALADNIAEAFRATYVTPAGRMMSDAQTAYALAICFGLACDEKQKQAMGERLAFLVRAAGYRISTGFVGTPLVCHALTETGHLYAASRILTQTECPSWLYPVTMGATTVWERWDSMLEDGSINPGQMTSFNHYALGAVAEWLHHSVGGLAPATPGYRMLNIKPTVLPGLDHARSWHETPYGKADAGWRLNGQQLIVEVTVPPNTTAKIVLPSGAVHEVGSGSHIWSETYSCQKPGRAKLSLSSGLAEIIDDPEAYEAVHTTISIHDEKRSRDFRRFTRWTPGRELRDPLNKAPLAILHDIELALAKLPTTHDTADSSTDGFVDSKADGFESRI